ncbi:hypothetical protein Cyrtocomes_01063 [Candidatus Cyrtobacter comes]|uniref:Uncharacterized protein n=1 Tax=Candidatus Cyrtobacter comes TaxID=675776 RepID=A0ABU5L970_9RICK|nr:hypothetical protein [Candidatus Cyrtobacter comes]MDZ5762672.1 hypothetical protein [Candidatus Cyrtobacter comes]
MFQRFIAFPIIAWLIFFATTLCYSEVHFGYPINTIIKGGKVQDIISTGASLRTMNGYQIPIKVGARSYFITGDSMKEVIKFLSEFKTYNVIAQTLGQDGHWRNGGGNVYLVIKNKSPKDYELIVKNIQALANKMNPIVPVADEIIKALSDMGVIQFSSAQEIFSYITDYVKSSEATDEIRKIYKETLEGAAPLFAPSAQPSAQDRSSGSSIGFKHFKLPDFLKAAKKVNSASGSIKYIFNKIFYKNTNRGLIGGELLDLKKGVIIEICSYPSVPNKAKGLLDLKSEVVNIDEVIRALGALK